MREIIREFEKDLDTIRFDEFASFSFLFVSMNILEKSWESWTSSSLLISVSDYFYIIALKNSSGNEAVSLFPSFIEYAGLSIELRIFESYYAVLNS